MFKRYLIIILLMLMTSRGMGQSLAALIQFNFSTSAQSDHMVFTLTQPTRYHIFTLSHPHRLVMDFEQTRLKVNLSGYPVRIGYPRPGLLRLVWDMPQKVRFTHYSKETRKQVIRVDLAGFSLMPNHPQPQMAANHQRIRVVIDPGHGGKDSGAVGKNGAREKEVVLMIAKRLAALINRDPLMQAELTRAGDYYIPLRGRLRIARQKKCDLFVSIHADSFFNTNAHGASVYTVSQRGATSEAARWLAAKNNHYSAIDEIDLKQLDDQSYVLRSVIIDLAQTATITDSLRLGTSLLEALNQVTTLHYTRVEQAPFAVLKSPDISSVLVEVGFISNPREESHLTNPHYQTQLASALLEGVQHYIHHFHKDLQ